MALTALLGVDDRIRLDLRGGGPHGRHAQHRALLVPGELVHLHDFIPEEGQQCKFFRLAARYFGRSMAPSRVADNLFRLSENSWQYSLLGEPVSGESFWRSRGECQ